MTEQTRLTYGQMMWVVKMERIFPEIDWQTMAVTVGYDKACEIWEDIKPFINE